MRGHRSTITILLFSDKRKRVQVTAMVHGPLAIFERVSQSAGIRWYVAHVATGRTLIVWIDDRSRAAEYVKRLLASGIRWDFKDRLSKPDRLRADEIRKEVKAEWGRKR